MEPMQQNETDREARLRELASKLFFSMVNQGGRFRLYRDADVSRPVRHEGLTLDEVEEILDTWNFAASMEADTRMRGHQTFGARINSTSRPLISITTSCPAT
jgi:hypothetical protein